MSTAKSRNTTLRVSTALATTTLWRKRYSLRLTSWNVSRTRSGKGRWSSQKRGVAGQDARSRN